MTEAKKPWAARACLFLVVALPLLSYPLSWLPADESRNLTLPFAALMAVLGLLWCAFRPISFPRALLLPAGCWLASVLLSVRFSQQPYASLGLLPVAAGNLWLLFLGANFPANRLRPLLWCWLGTALIVAVNGLVRLGSDLTVLSTIGNQNVTAAYLATAIPVALALRNRWATLSIILLLATLCFCHSRGAWLALGIMVVLGIVANDFRRLWLVVPAVALIGWLAVSQWHNDVRPVIWRGALKMAAARPLTGFGLGTFVFDYPQFRPPEYFARPKAAPVTDHAHNELLEIAAEQGLLGLAATLWLWLVAILAGWRQQRFGLLAALGVLIVHGLLDVGLRFPPNQPLFWLLLGLLMADTDLKTVTLQSRPARVLLAAGCVVAALWMLWAGVVQPVRADWLERKAELAAQHGDFHAAVADARTSVMYQSFRPHTRYLLASWLAQIPTAESQDAAIAELERLQELSPDYANVPANLGALLLARGRPAQAIPYLRRAVAINPRDADSQRALREAQAQL